MVGRQRRVGIWDLLWAPAVVVASVAAIVTQRVPAPYLPFIVIAGFAATVVEAGRWLAQARRDRRADASSHADVP
jgi:hypothetical protein